MTKAKISEYDAVAANNTDVNGVNIAENCPPSGMNNMGREIMAALKRFQVGSDGDGVTVGGNLVVSGTSTLSTTSISSADINAGTIDATAIGGSTPAAGSFTTLNTSGAVVFNDAGADVDFRVEGDTDANLLFVDASTDRVGIGTSSPTTKLHVSGGQFFASGENRGISLGEPNCSILGSSATTNSANIDFYVANAPRMRIDTSGNVTVGSTGNLAKLAAVQTSASAVCIRAENNQASVSSAANIWSTLTGGSNNNTTAIHFAGYTETENKFLVYGNGNVLNTNNSYGQISDIKTKQDVVDAASQWDDIKNIRVRKFRFKNNPTGPLQIGVVAQELEEVSPGLIDESPDYEQVEVPVLDEEGNPVLNEDGTPQATKERVALDTTTKSVKYSVLYMKAIKALQEAMERIETLEASNTALEARIAALEA